MCLTRIVAVCKCLSDVACGCLWWLVVAVVAANCSYARSPKSIILPQLVSQLSYKHRKSPHAQNKSIRQTRHRQLHNATSEQRAVSVRVINAVASGECNGTRQEDCLLPVVVAVGGLSVAVIFDHWCAILVYSHIVDTVQYVIVPSYDSRGDCVRLGCVICNGCTMISVRLRDLHQGMAAW